MKSLCFVFLFFSLQSYSQKTVFEYKYELISKGTFSPNNKSIDSTIKISAVLNVITSDRFMLFVVESGDFENAMFSGSVDDGDTLLFDIKNKRVFNFTLKEQSFFISKMGTLKAESFNNEIMLQDTVIILDKGLDKLIRPTPTLPYFSTGISSYKTKRFTFSLKEFKKSIVDLEKIYNRVSGFKYTGKQSDFIY